MVLSLTRVKPLLTRDGRRTETYKSNPELSKSITGFFLLKPK